MSKARAYRVRDRLSRGIMKVILGHEKFEEAFRGKLASRRPHDKFRR